MSGYNLSEKELQHIEVMKGINTLNDCYLVLDSEAVNITKSMVFSLSNSFKKEFEYNYKLNKIMSMDLKQIIASLLSIVKNEILKLEYWKFNITNRNAVKCNRSELELCCLFMMANQYKIFDVSQLNMVPNIQFVELLVNLIDENLYNYGLRNKVVSMLNNEMSAM